ncbi:hypothetical protein SANTM175S_05037 [Streptomyces antimycoticus]
MAKKMDEDSDTFEVVLAVGVLLQLGAGRPSARVRRHIVTTPVTLTVEPASINVTVSLVQEHPGRLEDTDFLSETNGAELLGVVRSAVEDVPFHPLSDRAAQASALVGAAGFRSRPGAPVRPHRPAPRSHR